MYWHRFRDALAAKDWNTFASLWHPEAIYRDRRTGLQSEVVGGDEVARVLRESFATRDFDYEIELLATRGDAGVFLSRFLGAGDEHRGPFGAQRLRLYIFRCDRP